MVCMSASTAPQTQTITPDQRAALRSGEMAPAEFSDPTRGVAERARDALANTKREVKAEAAHQMAGVAAHGLKGHLKRDIDEVTHDEYSDNLMVRAGQGGGDIVNVMLVIVIASVVGFVGIKATSETDQSIDVANDSEYQNASDSITSGFTSAMDLTEVVFIVLMLGVIIISLVGLRGRR